MCHGKKQNERAEKHTHPRHPQGLCSWAHRFLLRIANFALKQSPVYAILDLFLAKESSARSDPASSERRAT